MKPSIHEKVNFSGRSRIAAVVAIGLFMVMGGNVSGQEDPAPEVDASRTVKTSRLHLEKQAHVPDNPAMRDIVVEKDFYRRLPNYYGEVVSPEQRKTIYQIQEDYFQTMEMLRLRLALLKMERDVRILQVLSEQQRQEVARLEAAAEQKKNAKETKPDSEPSDDENGS